jgi:hypothetical protein
MRLVFPLLPAKWEVYFGYLALSINHFPLRVWAGILNAAGLRVDEVSQAKLPLVRIVASKASASVKGEAHAAGIAELGQR